MTERPVNAATQIESISQLESVVVAMRAIAASRAEQGRSLLAGIEAYAQVVQAAIGQALSLLPRDRQAPSHDHRARRGLIAFCTEQGFVGAFNEHILDVVAREPPSTSIFLLGTRGVVRATERGIGSAWTAPMATNTEAVPDLMNRLADALYAAIADDGLSRVDIVYARSATADGLAVHRQSLLPVELTQITSAGEAKQVLTNLSPVLLLERLAAEYVYAQLCQAAMHAFGAENEARLATMAAARTNIQTRLEALRQTERRQRQEKTTAEILELAVGAWASDL
jgi:F-type H+-transporting ATPase subunit gamma